MESMIMVSESELNEGAKEVRAAPTHSIPTPTMLLTTKGPKAKNLFLTLLFRSSSTLISDPLPCPFFTAIHALLPLFAPVEQSAALFTLCQSACPPQKKSHGTALFRVSVLSFSLGSRLWEDTTVSFTAL